MKKKRSFGPFWVLVPVAAILIYGVAFGHWFDKEQTVQVQGAKVERGRLTISVLQRGNLAAKDAVSVKSEIEGQTTILYLIPEGTFVKAGDLLVELDVSDLFEKKVAQEISVQNAESTYTKAKAQYEIQESQNQSDIEAAQRKLDFAVLDLDKYKKGDFAQLSAEADEQIKLAEAELAKARNTYEWSKNLAEKGFLTKSELDRDELDFQRAEVSLEQSKRAKELLTVYDDPRKRTELEANLKEAERGLERARLEAQARIADFESGMITAQSKLELEKEKLTRYVDQVAKAKIQAKQAGMVVYTRMDSGRMGGGEPVQEGSQVRERQEILTIPRTAGLIVEASVHESVLKRVEIGKACNIRVDAIPDREFYGTVQFVALLADKGSWWANPNQRLYKTEISVTNPVPEMRPGMSCSLEILSDAAEDCLYVPLQAVILHQGETIAFVATTDEPELRKIKVGRSNDKWVEIVEGLKEGEEVLLSPPPGFTPQSGEKPGETPASGQPAQAASGQAPTMPASGGNGAVQPADAAGTGMPPARELETISPEMRATIEEARRSGKLPAGDPSKPRRERGGKKPADSGTNGTGGGSN